MRSIAYTTLVISAGLGLIGCSSDSGVPSVPPIVSGEGGNTGMPATGGNTTVTNTASGSTTGVGGSTAKGGATGSGGTSTTAKGGTTSTGGTSTTAKGGTTSTGGTSTTAKGGTTSTGGTSTTAKGGTTSTGGVTGKGGTSTGGAATGGAATGGAATGGNSSGPTVTPLSNGTQGKTTRYWDCCKPSCGWSANAKNAGKNSPATSCDKSGGGNVGVDTQSVCSGGSAYQCNWGVPWDVSSTLSYGFAAYNGNNCGKCYQLDFTGAGDNPGAQSLKGKSMIVQAINIGDIGSNQFDILIPGGGVGANNGCSGNNGMWTSGANLGVTYGGFLATCGTNTSCVTSMCQAAFGSNSTLMAGCSWFTGWFASANNPGITYAEVACPAAITNKSGLK